MKRHTRLFFTVLLLMTVMCLCACSGNSEKKKFVGTWVNTAQYGDKVTVTFYEDSTFKWVYHLTLGDSVVTGRFEPDEKEKYLTMYPDRDPDDTIGTSALEWGFSYVVTSDYLTFYKVYSEEPVYAFKRQS